MLKSQQRGGDKTIQIEEKSNSEIREIMKTLDKKKRIHNPLQSLQMKCGLLSAKGGLMMGTKDGNSLQPAKESHYYYRNFCDFFKSSLIPGKTQPSSNRQNHKMADIKYSKHKIMEMAEKLY